MLLSPDAGYARNPTADYADFTDKETNIKIRSSFSPPSNISA